MDDFFQSAPRLVNTYRENRWLRSYLRYKLPNSLFADVDADLDAFGGRCAIEYLQLARQAERERPVHVPFDPWGRRCDEIRVSPAWLELQNISARERLISLAYKREQKDFSRVHQFAKLYLFHPSSAFFTCPLAMADGAAKVLETYGSEEVHRQAFKHLTSERADEFWTSGQWMTEKTGGSDVGGTSTEARLENGHARLYGTKWFSSATTSQMALALARYADSPQGSRGLSLFLVKTYAKPGELNHIRVLRLKDKLGTWALPTAELSLEGAYATPVGAKDHGVKTVATMLNVTRLYNSVCSIGQMARALDSLRDYSERRSVFGQPLGEQVLHYTTFVDEELKSLAGFLLTFELVHLLGKEECGSATAQESDILRLMTPVCKLFTARSAIQAASEVVEGFGGAGYIEDTGIPAHLRDSQVFPIWEGATNVLSLDMVRVVLKTQALRHLQDDLQSRLKDLRGADLDSPAEALRASLNAFAKGLQQWNQLPSQAQSASGRSLAFHLARLHAFSLLLSWVNRERDGNRKLLATWAEHFAKKLLGEWRLCLSEDCERSRDMWLGRMQ